MKGWGSEILGGPGPEELQPWESTGQTFARLFARTDGRKAGQTDGSKFSPMFYRTSSASGLLPKKEEEA